MKHISSYKRALLTAALFSFCSICNVGNLSAQHHLKMHEQFLQEHERILREHEQAIREHEQSVHEMEAHHAERIGLMASAESPTSSHRDVQFGVVPGMTSPSGQGVQSAAGAVCRIGSVEYFTLADAFSAAVKGDTVNLCCQAAIDSSETLTLPIGAVLSLNGYMFTNNGIFLIDMAGADRQVYKVVDHTGPDTLIFLDSYGNVKLKNNPDNKYETVTNDNDLCVGIYTSERIYATVYDSLYTLTDGMTYTMKPYYGCGALRIEEGSSMEGNNVSFVGNVSYGADTDTLSYYYSTGLGGAIYSEGNSHFTGHKVALSDNIATYQGGAIQNNGGYFVFETDSVLFEQNSTGGRDDEGYVCGGAIDNFNDGSITFSSSLIQFNSNNTLGYGGAIDNSSTISFDADNVTFYNNTAQNWGGAIENYSTISFDADDNVTFYNNAAYYGGAIDNDGNIEITSPTINFNGNNSERSGGAILNSSTISFDADDNVTFYNNAAQLDGGVIWNYGNIEITSPTINFNGNNSEWSGGAIVNSSTISFDADDNVTFYNNAADYGGAINNYGNGNIEITSPTINFNGNNSERIGGAIVNSSTISFDADDNVTFYNNAADDGGAIYNNGYGNIEITSPTINFSNNAAQLYGGAIWNYGNIEITSPTINFSNNNAAQLYGGAIWNSGYIGMSFDKALFSNNNAKRGGSALYNEDTIRFCGTTVTFNENKGAKYGDILSNYGHCLFDDSLVVFSNNVLETDSSDECSSSVIFNYDLITFKNDVTFSGNMANGTRGGGGNTVCNALLYKIDTARNVLSHGTIDIEGNATFSDNVSVGYGAILLNGTMTIKGNGLFTGNKNNDIVNYNNQILNQGGAIHIGGGPYGILNLSKATFSGNTATEGGAIYNEGTVNFSDKITLATATDDIYNCGTVNWNLTGGTNAHAILAGFQNLTNHGDSAKLTLTVKADQPLGSYVIATGDFSAVEEDSTNTFILTGVKEVKDAQIKIGDILFYNGFLYTLAIGDNGTPNNAADDALVLKISKGDEAAVNLDRVGTLAEKILEQVPNLAAVKKLTVTGSFNEKDWKCIVSQLPLLDTLDMKDATATFTTISTMNSNVRSFHFPSGIKVFEGYGPGRYLTEVFLNEGLEEIGNDCFYYNNGLHFISFPSTLKVIEYYAFSDCNKLMFADFSKVDGKTLNMESGIFSGCDSLLCVILPNDLTYIPDFLFSHCYNPYLVTCPNEMTPDMNYLKDHFSKEAATLYLGTYKGGALPKSIKTIGNSAFRGCKNLRLTSLPDNLASIGEEAFYGCTSLTSLTLPENLTSIGEEAFYGCTGLTSLTLPENLASIGTGAFNNCSSLTRVTSLIPLPIAAEGSLFDGVDMNTCTLVVPKWSSLLYKMAVGWSDFTNIETIDTGNLDHLTVSDERYFPASVRPDGTPDLILQNGGSLTVRGSKPLTMDTVTLCTNLSAKKHHEEFYWIDEDGVEHWKDYYYYTPTISSGILFNDNSTLTANAAQVNLYSTGGFWGFCALPFNTDVAAITHTDANDTTRFIIKTYDGARRAQVGGGGNWKQETGEIAAGKGFIYQCQDTTTLCIRATANSFSDMLNQGDINVAIEANPSDNADDAGWNLLGNPYPTCFDVHSMSYTCPITVWNGSSYDAVSLLDDDYTLSPGQAFFVQHQPGADILTFHAEGRLVQAPTSSSSNVASLSEESSFKVASFTEEPSARTIYNLTLSDGQNSDRCRVVINEKASVSYEPSCDAAKFFSDQAVPQLYTTDRNKVSYAINERPLSGGQIALCFTVPAKGQYEIGTRQAPADLLLTDNLLGKTVNLSLESYVFSTDLLQDEGRFTLMPSNVSTDIVSEQATTMVWSDGNTLHITGTSHQIVKVVSIDGKSVFQGLGQEKELSLPLPAGAYIVTVGNRVFKLLQ